ncbi:cysteine-rich receptor-like protein kinase 2 [Cryptomeria japonica]|uniref:cysteine-rich receptor-like protein kinase 2 n=1 Tax=Cryptomeria japonica TaxID=3369 RepID=UPI0027DA4FD9|nr:cysteine-rich receptor-like protein kinase 2 [Cryptomeria japonica]
MQTPEFCPPNNATLFEQIFNSALSSVVKEVGASGFTTKDEETSSETTTDSIYILAQCRKDKSSTDCINCIKVAENQIRNCSGVSAKAYYDGCYLCYESIYFYDLYTNTTHKPLCGDVDAANSDLISAPGRSLISDLCTATPQIKDYFVAQTRNGPSNTTIYGLAFCLCSIQEDSCKNCLSIAQENINKCFPRSEGRALDAGCYLRYSSEPFFPSNSTIELARFLPTGKRVSSLELIIVAVGGGVFLLALLTCILVFRKQIGRPSQKRADREGATKLREREDFDFKVLKKATNNFDQANKLGNGGFGEVFKGTLKNGEVVAVKKLTLGHSARAISEFKSEVKLISNVHHQNLVRLLGCRTDDVALYGCLHGPVTGQIIWRRQEYREEKPRQPEETEAAGENRGGGRGKRWGPAGVVGGSCSLPAGHGSRRQVWVYDCIDVRGYTAPEYANRGQLTEKDDTYSFGVVVLEIVSGRKSIDFKQPPHMQYLLQWVWSLYEDNQVLHVVESEKEMEGYSKEEVLRVINLALQCIQVSVRDRPSMSEVVTIRLSKDESDFQKPLQPSFMDVEYKELKESNATITESLNAQ